MKKRKLVCVMAMVLAMTSMAGCGSGTASSTAEDVTAKSGESTEAAESQNVEIQTSVTATDIESAHVDVVNIAAERDPTDMGPWAGNMGGASAIIPLVYQTLQIEELNGQPEPCLAKEVKQVDAYTYDIELFDYIKDSEGNAFTTSDVVFSIDTAKSLGKDKNVGIVDSIDVTDDYNFTVHFNESMAMGDLDNFLLQVKFVTQAAYEAEGNGMSQHPIGTGPYVMTNYTSGSVIEFTRNEDYWQTDEQYYVRSSAQNADVINYQIVTEALQRAIAIEGGTLDYGNVTLFDKQNLESKGYGVVSVPDNLTFMMFLNMDDASACSASKELREALFYAIDNESVSALFTSADSVPVYDISNSNYPDYYEDTYKNEDNYYRYDTAKAQELLAASGFNGELTLMCSSDEQLVELAEILKTFWSQIGITVNIESYQSNMLSDVSADPNNWDIYLLQYASSDYAVNVYEKVLNAAKYSWGGTINFVVDDELQKKLTEVRSIDNHTQENVVAFHDYLVDQAWCMGLVQGINYYATSSKIDADNVVMSEQRIIRPNATIYLSE